VNSGLATLWAAIFSMAGVLIAKAVDYGIARFSKAPTDSGEFRNYLLAQNKATSKRVDTLTAHVFECEKHRLALQREVSQLARENSELRHRLDLAQGVA